MKSETDNIDRLLEKPCYIIDFLPERVKQDSHGQFFDVESYFLNDDKCFALKNRFVNVILKLMCFYHISILWNGWKEQPSPKTISTIMGEMMLHHSGTLNVLLTEENTLVVFEGDSLNLSIYDPAVKVQSIMERIAVSEGLFWRRSEI